MRLAGLIYLVLLGLAAITVVPGLLGPAIVACGCSAVAVALYGLDKRAARTGGRRVPEKTLHGIALLGGWPGAALAQRVWRHKTQKASFQLAYRLTVAANLALTAAWAALLLRM